MSVPDFPATPFTGQIFFSKNSVVYQYNGTIWESLRGEPKEFLDTLYNTEISTPQVGDSLVYDGENWVNGAAAETAKKYLWASSVANAVPAADDLVDWSAADNKSDGFAISTTTVTVPAGTWEFLCSLLSMDATGATGYLSWRIVLTTGLATFGNGTFGAKDVMTRAANRNYGRDAKLVHTFTEPTDISVKILSAIAMSAITTGSMQLNIRQIV